MKPSAKRALLLPAWLERKLYWQVAGLFRPVACNRIRGVRTGGMGPFFRPGAAWQRCGWLVVGLILGCRWLLGKRCVGQRGGAALQ